MKRKVKSIMVSGHFVWRKMWFDDRSCRTLEYGGKKECKIKRHGYLKDFQILQMHSKYRSCVEKDIQHISNTAAGIRSSPPLDF